MKKFVALLLAVLMVALPIVSFAEDTSLVEEAIAAGRKATTTISLNQLFNDEELVGQESAELISTLLNALSLVITEQKDGGSLTLTVTSPVDEEALPQPTDEVATAEAPVQTAEPKTADLSFAYGSTDAGDSYLTSSLLGNQKLVVSDDEIIPFAKKLVNAAQLLGMLDAETAAQVQAQIDAADLEDVKKQLEGAFTQTESINIDDAALKAFMEKWMDSMTVAPVEGQPKNCDHAVSVITVDVSSEMLQDYYKFMMQSMSFLPAEVADAVMEQVANISGSARMYVDSQGDVVCMTVTAEELQTVYVDKDGEEMDLETVELLKQYLTEEEMVGRFEKVQTKLTSEMEITRLTRDHDVAYSLNVEVKQGDETIGTMTGSLIIEDNGHALAKLDMTAPSENPEEEPEVISVTVDVQTVSTETTEDTTVKVDVVVPAHGPEATVNTTSVTVNVQTARTETTEDTMVKVDVVVTEETAEEKDVINVNALCNVNAVKDGVDVTENASFVMTIDVNENGEEHHAKLIDISATTVTGEPDAPVADTACVHPAVMTDNEFLTWIGGLVGTLQMNLMTFVQTLPEEVLAEMMY